MHNFEWKHCKICGSYYIQCPECGNNTCSGGYGLDGNCKSCEKTYEYAEKNYPE